MITTWDKVLYLELEFQRQAFSHFRQIRDSLLLSRTLSSSSLSLYGSAPEQSYKRLKTKWVSVTSLWCRYVPYCDELQVELICYYLVMWDSKFCYGDFTVKSRSDGYYKSKCEELKISHFDHRILAVRFVFICDVTLIFCDSRAEKGCHI